MSSAYRPSQFGAQYLARIARQSRGDGVLAPDITTARDRDTDQHLAARAPAPDRAAANRAQASVLEQRYPDIVKAIGLLWGYPEMNEYFDRIWMADGRQGPIDPEAMSELMLLSHVHQQLVPQRPVRTLATLTGSDRLHGGRGNPWSDVPPRR
jgi:hypothetical protein